MRIYKFRLFDTSGYSTFGGGWTDQIVVAVSKSEATEILRRRCKEEHWRINSVDEYEIAAGLIL